MPDWLVTVEMRQTHHMRIEAPSALDAQQVGMQMMEDRPPEEVHIDIDVQRGVT